MSEIAQIVGETHTIGVPVKKRLVNVTRNNAGSNRKSIVGRDSLRNPIQSSPLMSVAHLVRNQEGEGIIVRITERQVLFYY